MWSVTASAKPSSSRSLRVAVLLGCLLGAACGGPSDGNALFDPIPSNVGAAGGAVTTTPEAAGLVALLDDVVIADPSGAQARAWRFDSDAEIADTSESVPGKWARTAFSPVGTAAGAHDIFSTQAGGCLENDAPFSGPSQYYEASVLFPAADYSRHHVSANVLLVSGGLPDVACPARAELFVVAPLPPLYPMADGEAVTLKRGVWQALNLDVPEGIGSSPSSTTLMASSRIDQLGLRITTYPCE